MAKTGLVNIATSDTFQIWLDRTNELIDLLGTDVITASATGDVTGSLAGPKNATLIGNFTANTITANTRLRASTISAVPGTSNITLENPTRVNSSSRVAFEAFSNNTDPVIRINNGTVAWDVGIDDDSQSFIINTGAAQDRFNLNTAGDLTISGKFTADEISVGTVNSNFVGDVYASDGVTKILENGTNGGDATFTGNVVGQVSDISNHLDVVLRIRDSSGTIVKTIYGASSNTA